MRLLRRRFVSEAPRLAMTDYVLFCYNASMARPSFRDFLTNLDQPMPLPEKLSKLTRNLWRRVILRQDCCGHDGEPGC